MQHTEKVCFSLVYIDIPLVYNTLNLKFSVLCHEQ